MRIRVSGILLAAFAFAKGAAADAASDDFDARCAGADVVKCVGFDLPADIAGAYGDSSGILAGATTPELDMTVRASGASSLIFTIPSNSAADTSGSYFSNFSDDLSVQMGPGDTFYVQWRQRFSPDFLSTDYPGGGGWKQTIIGSGDQPGQPYSSCSDLEVVTQNNYHRGFPQMYNSCSGSASHGAYDSFEEAFEASDFKLQNAMPAPYCLYSQGQTDPPSYFPPEGNCFAYVSDEWMTFQVGIELGQRVADEFEGSRVRLWVAHDGMLAELVIDKGPYNLSAGDPALDQRYGKVWLLPYNTGKDETAQHPPASTWYDELVISRSRIPDPGVEALPGAGAGGTGGAENSAGSGSGNQAGTAAGSMGVSASPSTSGTASSNGREPGADSGCACRAGGAGRPQLWLLSLLLIGMLRRRKLFGLAALVLAACGSSDDANPGGSAASGGAPSGGAASGAAGGGSANNPNAGTAGGGAGAAAGNASSAGEGPALPCDLSGAMHPESAQLAMLGDGAAVDLGEFSCTDPEGDGYACQQVTDYSGMVYDCKNHQILMFGGGHATTYTDSVFALGFDTLDWSELYAPTPCTPEIMSMGNFDAASAAWISGPSGPYPRPISRHTYDLNIYVDTLDELLLLEGANGDSGTCPPGSSGYDFAVLDARVAHYSLDQGTWSFSAEGTPDGHPEADGGEYPAGELDPVSGKVVILGRNGLYVYDPVTRIKTVALDNYNDGIFPEDLGYANHLVYFPPNDRFYYFDRNGPVWEVTFDRNTPESSSLAKLETIGTAPSHQEPGYAYDPSHQIIGGAVTDDVFFVFDPASGSWSSKPLAGSPGSAAFHAVSYDPVDGVFLFVTEARHTWAYRYAP